MFYIFRKLEGNEIGEGVDPLSANYHNKMLLPKTYQNHIFSDNFGIQHKILKETMSGSFKPENFTESLFYLCKII